MFFLTDCLSGSPTAMLLGNDERKTRTATRSKQKKEAFDLMSTVRGLSQLFPSLLPFSLLAITYLCLLTCDVFFFVFFLSVFLFCLRTYVCFALSYVCLFLSVHIFLSVIPCHSVPMRPSSVCSFLSLCLFSFVWLFVSLCVSLCMIVCL
jgi:hypothetical protein